MTVQAMGKTQTSSGKKVGKTIPRAAWSRAEYGPRIGVCLPTLDKMLASGELGHLRVGSRVVITEQHEREWIKTQTVKVPAS